jgi:hypothetical protein
VIKLNELEEQYKKDYNNIIDINNIEWIKLSAEALKSFLEENYYDKVNNEYVAERRFNQNPLGFHYLTFKINKNCNYLLGVTTNSINKKTILVALTYIDKYYRYLSQTIPLTYLITIETNKYFRNQGLFNAFCNNLILFINPNQHILATKESELGSQVHVIEREKIALLNNGYTKEIFINDEHLDWNLDFYNTVCPEYPKKSLFKRGIKSKK